MGQLTRALKPLVERIPGLADYYRSRRDASGLNGPVLYRASLGFKFNGPSAMERGDFEPDETKIFDTAIGHFDLLVNIGANVGYYALRALARGKDVVAFEPNSTNLKMLLRNVDANEFDADAHLFPIALSKAPGVLPLYGASTGASLINGWAGTKSSSFVPVNAFDNVAASLVRDRTCFVLVDVEGAELDCLKGCDSLFKDTRTAAFLVEITVGQHQPKGTRINPNLKETFALFFDQGFRAFTADAALREIKLADIDQVLETGEDTLGAHNFLFVSNVDLLAQVGLKVASS